MYRFVKESWLMVVLSITSGLAVAAVYSVEKPRIEQNARDFLNRSVLDVVPGGARVETVEPAALDGLTGIHRVYDGQGQFVGWGVEGVGPGFQGFIRLVIGLDSTARSITGIQIVAAEETPGLGDNIKKADWRSQFRGKQSGDALEVVKAEPSRPYHIHAITAATISSKAVVDIVNNHLERVRKRLAQEAARS